MPSPITMSPPSSKGLPHIVTNEQGEEVPVPAEFICPITLELMEFPLVDRRGLSFERAAILKWLGQGNGQCPLTRVPMKVSDLIRNRPLEATISFWRQRHGIPQPRPDQIFPFPTHIVGYVPVSTDVAEAVLQKHQQADQSPSAASSPRGTAATSIQFGDATTLATHQRSLRNSPSESNAAIALEARQAVQARRRRYLSSVLETACREMKKC